MRVVTLMTAVCVLSACAITPAERSAQVQREVDQMIAIYGPACSKLGYVKESDPWRDCVLNLAAQDNMKRYYRYHSYPTTTQCFGHHGFYNCTTF